MDKSVITMNRQISRRQIIIGGLASAALVAGTGNVAFASKSDLPPIKVFKSPSCGCCGQWVDYMTKHGYSLQVENRDNLDAIKKMARVPEKLWSCHTSVVGNYIVEGHVPVEGIRKLLAKKPKLAGIALPGMPSGSPGMPGPKEASFELIGFTHDGKTSLFKKL